MDVRVRRLRAEEALLAAALHVQSMHASGRTPAPGQLDRYAVAWHAGGDLLPQWVAEVDGRHCGTLLLRLQPALPPGVGDRSRGAEVALLFDAEEGTGIEEALLEAARQWCRAHDLQAPTMPTQV